MITRVSEALTTDGLQAEFLDRLRELVADFPARHAGLVRQQILVDQADPRRIQYVSVWQHEAALVAYAGVGWRTDPVTFPDEERYLAAPLALRHFTEG